MSGGGGAGAEVSPLGHPRVHLRRTDSTNDRARALAIAGAPHGTLVTASEQTAGRGRQGRRWSAPPRSALLMSLLLRSPPPLLPLLAAVAVCDAAGEQTLIKWPNDIVLDATAGRAGGGRRLGKLGGILTEGRPQQGWAVLGIGLNVAVSLEELCAELRAGTAADEPAGARLPPATLGLGPAAVEPTLARVLEALEERLREAPARILDAWRSRDALRGREITWGTQAAGTDRGLRVGRGRAEGIDGLGRLVVALANGGRAALAAGEVHLQGIDED